MTMRIFQATTIAALCLVASLATAQNAEPVTVQSLLSQDFTTVGAVPSKDGPGLFLQKKDKMFFCLVIETPGSTSVTTRYCKPVR